jgi:hypothetical protein
MDSGVYRNIEWDIYMLNTGSVPLELAYGEFYSNFDPNIRQGGTLTFSTISSELPLGLAPSSTVSIAESRLTSRSMSIAPPGQGYIISSTYPGTKIARVRLRTNAISFITFNLNLGNEMNLSWRTGPSTPFTKIMANIGSTLTDITNPSQTYVVPNFYGMFIYQTIPWDSYSAKLLNFKAAPEGLYNTSTGRLNKRDTVTIEVRHSFFPYDLVSSFKSRLDSVNLSTFSIQAVRTFFEPGWSYYVVVKHRNSIETWTPLVPPFNRGGSINQYNMINSASSAYGNNLKLVNSTYCIYSGDVNQDKVIDLKDLILVYEDSKKFVTGYFKTDLNGDNIVNSADLDIVYNNSINFISAIIPN